MTLRIIDHLTNLENVRLNAPLPLGLFRQIWFGLLSCPSNIFSKGHRKVCRMPRQIPHGLSLIAKPPGLNPCLLMSMSESCTLIKWLKRHHQETEHKKSKAIRVPVSLEIVLLLIFRIMALGHCHNH